MAGNIDVGRLTISASWTGEVSTSTAAAGGLLAAGVNLATAEGSPQVLASIADGASVDVAGDASVQATPSVLGTAHGWRS